MISSVAELPELHDVAKVVTKVCEGAASEVKPKGLGEAVSQIQSAIDRRCYHEASDMLACAWHIKEAKPELRVARALLEILCQMALSNLDKAQNAWQDLEEILSCHQQLNNSKIMLLGARLYWAKGSLKAAISYSEKALSLASDSKEGILSRSIRARIQYDKDGDADFVLEELLPHWSTLGIDCSYTEESKELFESLRLALALASLGKGRLHLAKEVIGHLDSLRTAADLEMHLIGGVIHICSGNQELAIRTAQDIDLVRICDGSSQQERGSLLWWQAWIYHATGNEREAQRKAEDLHALDSAFQASGFQAYADLLLASCLVQRKSFSRAAALLRKYLLADRKPVSVTEDSVAGGLASEESSRLNYPLKTVRLICEALLLYEDTGLRKAQSLLTGNREELFNSNSLMILCLMCHAHEQLFALLCKSFGVEQLPTEFTDLLDVSTFLAKFKQAEKQLQQDEVFKLQGRFLQCSEQSFYLAQRRKPLEIRLFGGLEVSVGGNVLDLRGWGNSKTRSLFISLSLRAGSELAREVLVERLWPNQKMKDFVGSYNVTWCQMRKKLLDALPLKTDGEPEFIYDSFQNSGGRCALKLSEAYVDVQEFDNLNAKLADYRHDGNRSACLATIRMMGEIYKGDLLPGDCYLEWLELDRRHYRKQFVDAMILGASICLENDDPDSALLYLRKADFPDNFNEELHYLNMKAHAAIGRREEAMNIYHKCRHYLSEEFGLDPSQRIVDIYQGLLCEST